MKLLRLFWLERICICGGTSQEHAEEALATLQREHARSQQKMGALLESRAKNVGDLRQQLEYQIESLKSKLDASQVRRKTRSRIRSRIFVFFFFSGYHFFLSLQLFRGFVRFFCCCMQSGASFLLR